MDLVYGRDLDLNLLRVFLVVAEQGSVTAAASQLYLTQPAVSAALRRLTSSVGTPLFVREGRGLALTHRGRQLLGAVRPHLAALVDAALSPATFEPLSSTRTFRLGLSDATEAWLLPPLLRELEEHAPGMRFVVVPVQFRTVVDALASRQVDLAVSVVDELPAGIRQQPLLRGHFVCLFDPRHAKVKKRLTEQAYFAHEHVIVSYNGDLRGVVEDLLGKSRRIRCSVSSFHSIGAIVDGSALLATVPTTVASQVLELRPHLRTARLPIALSGSTLDLLWPAADDDDPAARFVRERVVKIADSAS
jgi:LysR family transcriptional activator of mexEF-oprN operon